MEYRYEAEHFYAQADAADYYVGSPGALGLASLVVLYTWWVLVDC